MKATTPSTFILAVLSSLLPLTFPQTGFAATELTDVPANAPGVVWMMPFVALLLVIALFPLIPAASRWWEHNKNKLLVALGVSAITLIYYAQRGYGFEIEGQVTAPGIETALKVFEHSMLDYIPFIVLLFTLFVVSGGIRLSGDIAARPGTNTAFLGVGAVLASIIGTTGASMLMIRPLLRTNQERKFKAHTVCFFIFLVSNIGGLLTPLGDPPLFLGYLKGVPFSWPILHLWHAWIFMLLCVMAVYFVWDSILYKRESIKDITRDNRRIEPLLLHGKINLLWLAAVIFCTAAIDPDRQFLGTSWQPFLFARELALLVIAGLSLYTTVRQERELNQFTFGPIIEVACLFVGIFITMQIPIEILRLAGPALGLTQSWQYFWASGILSSFLDNAPTYVVFFETAGALPVSGDVLNGVMTATHSISLPLLVAVSCGSVFMGANSYIGNGPNFMVKSIAESSGVKMPTFFGYMFIYSIPVLIPLFLIFTFAVLG